MLTTHHEVVPVSRPKNGRPGCEFRSGVKSRFSGMSGYWYLADVGVLANVRFAPKSSRRPKAIWKHVARIKPEASKPIMWRTSGRRSGRTGILSRTGFQQLHHRYRQSPRLAGGIRQSAALA